MPSGTLNKEDIKWVDAENRDATNSSIHAYYSNNRIHEFYGNYIGNSSLCNKNAGISEDGETFLSIDKFHDDTPSKVRIENEACKRCLKIYNKLK